MAEYTSTVTIDAPAERVWSILTDAAGYADWNPEIIGLDGHIALGARVTAHVKLGDGAVRRVPQRVTALDAPRRMEWVGGMPLGLFVGRRTFTVERRGAGASFVMHVSMTGVLAPLILKSVGDRQPELDKFSAALKQRAESSP